MTKIDFKSLRVGIPCCREEDYGAFVAIFEDANDLPATWERFFNVAKKAEQEFLASGQAAVIVYIDPQSFARWCQRKGYRIDSKARHRYAAIAVQ